MTAIKTCHRQFGSKARTAAEILRLVPDGMNTWVEVFCGTAALTLAKEPHKAEHINDMNGDVVNLFEVLRNKEKLDRLCELLEFTPWAQAELEFCKANTDIDDQVERARRFLVWSWQGVGGKQTAKATWRLEKKNGWCMGTWSRVPERLRAAALRLKEVYIHRRDCVAMVKMFADHEDAILFVDPPYPTETLNVTGSQYAVDMTPEEHEIFANVLKVAHCKIIMTMNPGTIYGKVLDGWQETPLRVRGLRNSIKVETIYTNFEPDHGLFKAGSA